jgi:RHS repeat-associated protein
MHEHLDVFGLINMNGRVYDPLTSMFLSPDPYLQAPGDWLNYNRYGYCYNNPFKYTDPTGEFAWFIPLIFFAVQSGVMQGATAEMNGGNFWGGFAKGAAISAASSLLTFGVGEVLGHAAGSFGTELVRAGAHGAIGGLSNRVNGGDFWQGFAISSISSLTGSGMQAVGWDGDYLPFATGLAGAGTAWATSGDPINGFFQGFGVGAMNHKGERLLGDDGVTMLEMSCDDIEVMPRSYMFGGTWYNWSPILGCYMERRVIKEGLENVYPEFDVLMMGRGMYNAARGLFTSSAASLWPAASGGRTVINGIEYTTHALERMQPVGTIMKGATSYSRGISPSVVENAVKFGKVTPGNTAAEVVRTFDNVRVITNPAGTRVISVFKISK